MISHIASMSDRIPEYLAFSQLISGLSLLIELHALFPGPFGVLWVRQVLLRAPFIIEPNHQAVEIVQSSPPERVSMNQVLLIGRGRIHNNVRLGLVVYPIETMCRFLVVSKLQGLVYTPSLLVVKPGCWCYLPIASKRWLPGIHNRCFDSHPRSLGYPLGRG